MTPPGSPPLPPPLRFEASDGYPLGYRLWHSIGPPRGLVISLHGIQSHSGWYGYSSATLAAAGYVVAGLDRRGSGMNAEHRGDAVHAERLINDVVQFTAHLDRTGVADGTGRVLAAVSWGGKLATAVAARRPEAFCALALLYPALRSRITVNGGQKFGLRLASAVGIGRQEAAIPLDDPALFTDAREFREFIRRDPLALRRVTMRFLNATVELDRIVEAESGRVGLPALLMLAGRDRIVDNESTRDLFVRFESTDKTIRLYPDACHTLEFEPDRNRFVGDLIDWLNRVCPDRPGLPAPV